MSLQCPHNVLTMSSGAWSNVITHTSHSSGRLKRRFFFVCIFICICVRFLFVFVPGLYLYLCQVCTENFRKRCQISFKQQAFNETVTFKNSENIHCPSSVFCTSCFKIHDNQYASRCGSATSL